MWYDSQEQEQHGRVRERRTFCSVTILGQMLPKTLCKNPVSESCFKTLSQKAQSFDPSQRTQHRSTGSRFEAEVISEIHSHPKPMALHHPFYLKINHSPRAHNEGQWGILLEKMFCLPASQFKHHPSNQRIWKSQLGGLPKPGFCSNWVGGPRCLPENRNTAQQVQRV